MQTPNLTDEWWTPPEIFNGKVAPRRILASDGKTVIFSDGAKRTKECTKKQFDAWIKKYGCYRVGKSL